MREAELLLEGKVLRNYHHTGMLSLGCLNLYPPYPCSTLLRWIYYYIAKHFSEDSSLANTDHSLKNHDVRILSGMEARAQRSQANNVVKSTNTSTPVRSLSARKQGSTTLGGFLPGLFAHLCAYESCYDPNLKAGKIECSDLLSSSFLDDYSLAS